MSLFERPAVGGPAALLAVIVITFGHASADAPAAEAWRLADESETGRFLSFSVDRPDAAVLRLENLLYLFRFPLFLPRFHERSHHRADHLF